MYLAVLALVQLFFLSHARKELVRDYFLYKNISRVVGFSCEQTDEILRTVRTLSEANISASIKRPELKFNFAKFMSADVRRLGVFVDARCEEQNAVDIFRNASERLMFDESYNWLVLAANLNDSLKLLNDSTFSVTTDVVVCVQNGDSYDFYDVYNICKYRGGSLIVTKCGGWWENSGLNLTLVGSKISRRWNLRGLTLNVATILRSKPKDMPLIEYLEDESTKPMDSLGRNAYSLIKNLPEMFNFTANVSAFTSWEANDTNGPLMKALKEGSIDIGFYAAKITPQRLDLAKVSAQVWPLRTCFMFLTTPSTKIKINTILRPWATATWYTAALVLLLVLFLFSCILRLEYVNTNDETHRQDVLFIIVAAICQQGFPFVSNQLSSRIAFLQIAIFGLLMYNYYSAAIVSARLYEPLTKMNDSLYSLVRSRMKLGSDKSFYLNFLLSDPDWEVKYFKNYWNSKVPDSQKFVSKDEGMQKIMKGGFAYHADPNDAYPYIHRYLDDKMICQLTEVHLLKPGLLATWSSYNGQFHEISKIGLLRMMSAGLRLRQVWHWTTKAPFCRKDVLTIASVTIYDAAPIILLLLCGVLLSLVIFFIEKIAHDLTRRKVQHGSYLNCERNVRKLLHKFSR